MDLQTPRPAQDIELSFVQAVLLRDICRSFCGLRSTQVQQQYDRNMLLTICKILKVRQKETDSQSNNVDACLEAKWQTWLAAESLNRLLHCVFRE
jgi:hypothetical protein